MRDATEQWFPRRTWTRPTWTAAELTAARAGRTVSVVLPALTDAVLEHTETTEAHPGTPA